MLLLLIGLYPRYIAGKPPDRVNVPSEAKNIPAGSTTSDAHGSCEEARAKAVAYLWVSNLAKNMSSAPWLTSVDGPNVAVPVNQPVTNISPSRPRESLESCS